MTCEHEPARFKLINKGLFEEVTKEGYLRSHYFNETDVQKKTIYERILYLAMDVHANYYTFPTSQTRMIGLINPFYSLFYDDDALRIIGNVPDIWPTSLSKDALEKNKTIYKKRIGSEFDYTTDDQYIYKVKDLSLDDVIIINNMMLDRADELVGFVETSKIIRSLNTYRICSKGGAGRNDYDPLIKELYSLGYDFVDDAKCCELARKMDYGNYHFSDAEQKYIDYRLEFRRWLKKEA